MLGAGPIGLEMAFAYAGLGAEVHVIGRELLPREGARVRAFVQGLLEREGIELSLGGVERVQRTDPGIAVHVGDDVVRGDMFLVAAGRRPNIQGLELEKASVRFTARGIQTDRWLRTAAPNIFAAGDVLGGAQFTHLAGWQCFQAVRNALLPGKAVGIPRSISRVTFLEPEVASVGPTEEMAREELGQALEVHEWPLSHADRGWPKPRRMASSGC